uniref:Uncharacterized protein n=1 Tax=Oryza brachyantha TaxID=4533 RepID=J3LWD5_ORYBR
MARGLLGRSWAVDVARGSLVNVQKGNGWQTVPIKDLNRAKTLTLYSIGRGVDSELVTFE